MQGDKKEQQGAQTGIYSSHNRKGGKRGRHRQGFEMTSPHDNDVDDAQRDDKVHVYDDELEDGDVKDNDDGGVDGAVSA